MMSEKRLRNVYSRADYSELDMNQDYDDAPEFIMPVASPALLKPTEPIKNPDVEYLETELLENGFACLNVYVEQGEGDKFFVTMVVYDDETNTSCCLRINAGLFRFFPKSESFPFQHFRRLVEEIEDAWGVELVEAE